MKKRKFQTGGDVEEKKRKGLAASSGEKVGFLERLRMGNIDDPTSEAYKRFGAGRGAMPAPDTTPYSETADARNLMMAAARERAAVDTDESGIGRYARETGIGTLRQPAKDVAARATPRVAPKLSRERSVQPSSQDIDRLEAASTASRMRAERDAYMRNQAAKAETPAVAPPSAQPTRQTRTFANTGYNEYERIRQEGKERRAKAAEPKEEKKPGRRPQRGPKTEVPPRPSRALSTPASRKAWDEKYGDKYEASGKRKAGMKAGGMVKSSASKRADGCAIRGKTRGRIM